MVDILIPNYVNLITMKVQLIYSWSIYRIHIMELRLYWALMEIIII